MKQFDLLFSVRRKIGVAAFGSDNAITPAIPNEKRFAEAGAGGEERASAARLVDARIENGEIGWIEIFDAVSPGAEIVEESHVLDGEFLGKDGGIDGPRKIGGADPIVDDGTGNPEASGANFFVTEVSGGDAREFLGDEIEGGEILAAEALLENRREPSVFFGKEREIAFGAADVTGQYHKSPQH